MNPCKEGLLKIERFRKCDKVLWFYFPGFSSLAFLKKTTAIPIHPAVREAAILTGNDPIDFALSGGEDFELLFSMTPENMQQLTEKGVQVTAVGQVTDADAGRTLRMPDGATTVLSGGYNHFS